MPTPIGRSPGARRLIPPLLTFWGNFEGKMEGGGRLVFRRLKWPIADDARTSFPPIPDTPVKKFAEISVNSALSVGLQGAARTPLYDEIARFDKSAPPKLRYTGRPWGRPLRYEAMGACDAHQADLRASRRQGDGGWGFRRAVTAFTITEESAPPPPDIPAPRAALRSKLCIGNEATALSHMYSRF